jgi:excinuclease UvrABC nuclease subunit
LVGHPHAGKLRLTIRLPHRCGVYWFTDAAGHVLYVGSGTDLQSQARTHLTGPRRGAPGRLLRQLHAVEFRVCSDAPAAAALEGHLARRWRPPFNQLPKAARRRARAPVARTSGGSPDASTGRRLETVTA